MSDRPYVLLSAAVSLDGRLDDASPARLRLSNAEDLARVDAVRAEVDAILVGAETVRRDDPTLEVHDPGLRLAREVRGEPAHPLKVTVTRSGLVTGGSRYWRTGGARLVYTEDAALAATRAALGSSAEVVTLGPSLDFGALLDDLGRRGVRRLMVEGGGLVHTAFLAAGLADELQLAIAPLLVGDAAAPRFLHAAAFPGGSTRRLHLADVRREGDVVLLRYLLSDRAAGHGA